MRLASVSILLCFSALRAYPQFIEPSGGLYPANLHIFRDDFTKGIETHAWSATTAIDQTVKRSGTASWRIDAGSNSGVHIVWGGGDKDTMVFWVHNTSHVSFWVRPGNDGMTFQVQLGYMDGQFDVIAPREIGRAQQWRQYDVLVPSSALKRPLNEVKIMFPDKGGTVHFDDIKISNVRLYAGKGEQQTLKGVFADQIGYDTNGYKTFSAEKYTSYQIVRVSDKKVMYTGTDKRLVTHRAIDPWAVYVGDFTNFTTPGKYVIRLDNGTTSHPFEIGPDVYDARLRAAIRFFYYQRNNTEIKNPYAEGPWVHEKDEKELVLRPRSMGGTQFVRKGWHDAGDLAIYMPNHTYACFWMAKAWEDFGYSADNLNIPESGNGIPDLIDELRWGLDWILDMQDTTDGGFFHNMCVLKNSPYTYGRTTPLTITGYELTNKTTSATAAATAMLAYASTIFEKKLDPAYAARMKRAALKGWSYLEANPKQISITENCDTYQDDDDSHARLFAAAALFLATGEENYHRYFIKNDPGSTWIAFFNNQTNMAYLLYLKAPNGDPKKQAELRNHLLARAQETNAERERHPFGFVGYYQWGSLGTACARVNNYNILDWTLNKNIASLHTAQQQLHYIFGQNSLGFVYFSGFGVNGMKNAFHHWLKTLNATPHNFPGLLPGGPNENPDYNDMKFPNGYNKPPDTPIDQRYTDNDSWSTNEIAVNQSSDLLYLLAAMQSYAKGRNP